MRPEPSEVNFINVLRAHFLYKVLAPKNYKAETKLQSRTFQFCKFLASKYRQKSVSKMLMKLTPGRTAREPCICKLENKIKFIRAVVVAVAVAVVVVVHIRKTGNQNKGSYFLFLYANRKSK